MFPKGTKALDALMGSPPRKSIADIINPKSYAQAMIAAIAINETRIVVNVHYPEYNKELDNILRELEMSLYKRADKLKRAKGRKKIKNV